MESTRLKQQIEFIVEIDRLKRVFRQNVVIGTAEQENDAEHSWHLAVMAMLLLEYSSEKLNSSKVLKMLLIHDLVEIHAGDTFCYDKEGNLDKLEREQRAADKLFNILPSDQAQEIMDLWEEFEAVETPEARYAASLDRLQPLLLNYNTFGHTWKRPGITSKNVLQRNQLLEKPVPELWDLAQEIIEDSIQKGYLKRS
ncbi:HD domain-containing protein [Desulfosporosinus sp. SB140]|uniref:HD domain-containing protein n=1 Tax=Desulfosporosinus paludis TaxID=3115649 RepID=UPI003890C9E7